ncbi:MAG: FMN-binding negative transcriptional regulator [Cypionkella sp.]
MHPNPVFRDADTVANLAFAAERGFGILTAGGPEGPLCAHVPFILGEGFADLHLARSNALGRAVAAAGRLPALIAVSGPDCYISPDWYGAPDQVPTWNYVAVHLRGMLEPLPEAALHPMVDEVSAHHEARLLPKQPWVSTKIADGVMDRMLRMILPFRLHLTAVEGTWKLNQNKTPQVRAATVQALDQQDDAGARGIAALMRERL